MTANLRSVGLSFQRRRCFGVEAVIGESLLLVVQLETAESEEAGGRAVVSTSNRCGCFGGGVVDNRTRLEGGGMKCWFIFLTYLASW